MLIYKLNIQTSQQLVNELKLINCDPYGIKIMAEKRSLFCLKIINIPGYLALIIKESLLSQGGECAVPRATIRNTEKACDIILLANPKQLQALSEKLKIQAFRALRELSGQFKPFLTPSKYQEPLYMGILNVTPDSFYDGGKYLGVQKALDQAGKLLKAGAKILDIGGESTKPGAEEISTKEELKRTLPVIKAIRKKYPKAIISIDTTKPEVAKAACQAGAKIINDISGLKHSIKIGEIAAQYQTKLILMHRSAPSKNMQQKTDYSDILKEILLGLNESLKLALAKGVNRKNIIIDPGIGFGKTTAQNLYLIRNLSAFKTFGCPILLGASRKSVIGNVLNLPAEQRLEGTIATSIMAILNQADYLRVHDVRENQLAVKMFINLLNSGYEVPVK